MRTEEEPSCCSRARARSTAKDADADAGASMQGSSSSFRGVPHAASGKCCATALDLFGHCGGTVARSRCLWAVDPYPAVQGARRLTPAEKYANKVAESAAGTSDARSVSTRAGAQTAAQSGHAL